MSHNTLVCDKYLKLKLKASNLGEVRKNVATLPLPRTVVQQTIKNSYKGLISSVPYTAKYHRLFIIGCVFIVNLISYFQLARCCYLSFSILCWLFSSVYRSFLCKPLQIICIFIFVFNSLFVLLHIVFLFKNVSMIIAWKLHFLYVYNSQLKKNTT